jgi:hypothetical protein
MARDEARPVGADGDLGDRGVLGEQLDPRGAMRSAARFG